MLTITPEQIFQLKTELEKQIGEYERALQALVSTQSQLHKPEELAQSILAYETIEQQIADRAHLFSLLSLPQQSLADPYVKAELFSYISAAETIGPQVVNVLADDLLAQVRLRLQAGEDDTLDQVQAEFKEYILPAKIIAQKFDELDIVVDEMNRSCQQRDPQYDIVTAAAVLRYAFQVAIDADIEIAPVVAALRQPQFHYLTEADRAQLLDHVEERLAVLRFETAKKQTVAMDKAIAMLERRTGSTDLLLVND